MLKACLRQARTGACAVLNLNLWQRKPENSPRRPAPAAAVTPARPLLRIVVLNAKGGCGKTTLSTNLAGYYAARGYRTALLDADTQGSSLRWLKNRGGGRPPVSGIAGAEQNGRVTRSFQLRIPPGTERLIVDTPAAFDPLRLREFTRGADAILIPVLPSDIDIHAASRCIAELLLTVRIEHRAECLAVVANRVKKNTRSYDKLKRFLATLDIPFVASFRDTQHYAHAAELGLSVCELEQRNTREDAYEWERLVQWLETRRPASAPPAPPAQSAG